MLGMKMSLKHFITVVQHHDRASDQIQHFNEFIGITLIKEMGRQCNAECEQKRYSWRI